MRKAAAFRLVSLLTASILVIVFLNLTQGARQRSARASSNTSQEPANRIDRAIERGLRFLERIQLPSGGFPGLLCQTWEMTQCVEDNSPAYTTFVLHAVSFLPPGRIQRIRERAVAFLLDPNTQDRPGIWSYWPKDSPRHNWIPPDLDDTASARAALLINGRKPPGERLAQAASALRAPSGLYAVWFGLPIDANELDCVVTANALFGFALEGNEDPGSVAYLNRLLTNQPLEGCSSYYPRHEAFFYLLSRAYHDGGVSGLQPAVTAATQWLREQQQPDGGFGNVAMTAFAAVTWLNAGQSHEALERAVSWLLDRQRKDGGWDVSMIWAMTYIGAWLTPAHGSEAANTALALEALIKAKGHYSKR